MGSFRRVEGEQAGPDALGILIPPARRTFVIFRPRNLPWDLLLIDSKDLKFRELSHDEASAAAQGLYRALRDCAAGGPGSIEMIFTQDGFWLRVLLGPFALLVCLRQPGQPYVPLVCSEVDAHDAASRLWDVIRPPGTTEQEVYFNTRFFGRTPD
jgi:hypothetical protein